MWCKTVLGAGSAKHLQYQWCPTSHCLNVDRPLKANLSGVTVTEILFTSKRETFCTRTVKHLILSLVIEKESPPAWTQEAYRPRRIKYSICCPIPGGGGAGVPTMARGVPTLVGGYLPCLGGTYLGQPVPTLDRGYLPWLGVPTLARGYLRWPVEYLPWLGVPPARVGALPDVDRLKT